MGYHEDDTMKIAYITAGAAGMYCGTLLGVGAMACGFPGSTVAGLTTAGMTRWFVDYDFNDFLFFVG